MIKLLHCNFQLIIQLIYINNYIVNYINNTSRVEKIKILLVLGKVFQKIST